MILKILISGIKRNQRYQSASDTMEYRRRAPFTQPPKLSMHFVLLAEEITRSTALESMA